MSNTRNTTTVSSKDKIQECRIKYFGEEFSPKLFWRKPQPGEIHDCHKASVGASFFLAAGQFAIAHELIKREQQQCEQEVRDKYQQCIRNGK